MYCKQLLSSTNPPPQLLIKQQEMVYTVGIITYRTWQIFRGGKLLQLEQNEH